MKVAAKVISTRVEGDQLLATLQFNSKLPPQNARVSVRWGSKRSIDQNSLYWKYLTSLIEDAGLKSQGHFSPEALHENFKTHFLAEKTFDKDRFRAIEEKSTTDLTKVEFGEYFEKIDQLVNAFFGIDTSPFWEEYKDYSK